MEKLPRREAEATLSALRAVRPLYADLRPAFTRLDALVAVLERRGFSGVICATGDRGQGALWIDRGVVVGAWWLPPGEADAAVHPVGATGADRIDPADVLRMFLEEQEAVIAVHPGVPPESLRAGSPAGPDQSPAADPSQTVAQPSSRQTGWRAEDAANAAAVPWIRLLPEALNRVKRHRGGQVAGHLEEAVNMAIQPASLKGGRVLGVITPAQGAAALRTLVAGLTPVAGATFVRQLLQHVGEEMGCAEVITGIVAQPEGGGDSPIPPPISSEPQKPAGAAEGAGA